MTQSVFLFLSLCAALAFFLAWVVVRPWAKAHAPKAHGLMGINIQTFYDRLSELEADKACGTIDVGTYEAQVVDLKRQLLAAQQEGQSVPPASLKSRLIVLLWVPILALMAYLLIGNRTPVFELWHAKDTLGQVADDLLTAKIDAPPDWATKDSAALISAMQVNVHDHANDPKRWLRLSELFLSLKADKEALEALARAYRLAPNNEQIAATYTQIAFFANQGTLDDTVKSVLHNLLLQNPKHEGAMMILAMGETRGGNFEAAKAWVDRLRSGIAAKSGDHSAALQSLDKMATTIEQQSKAAQEGIALTVNLSDDLKEKIGSDDVLFVSIASPDGGPPYAVQRLSASSVARQALTVTLSDANAMLPKRTLSSAKKQGVALVANARISKSGNAITQSGDWIANPVPVLADSKTLALTIAQMVP